MSQWHLGDMNQVNTVSVLVFLNDVLFLGMSQWHLGDMNQVNTVSVLVFLNDVSVSGDVTVAFR